MAEEHRCQAPRLCVNNCGFFGSPATQNLCSKCYRDLQLNEQQSSNAKLVLNQTLTSPSSPTSSSSCSSIASASAPISFPVTVDVPKVSSKLPTAATTVEDKEETTPIGRPNRCSTCRKRVGLTGFKCRCEMVFCGSHRYPEHHDCTFDFKTMGKEQIAKANPLVKAEKLEKI